MGGLQSPCKVPIERVFTKSLYMGAMYLCKAPIEKALSFLYILGNNMPSKKFALVYLNQNFELITKMDFVVM